MIYEVLHQLAPYPLAEFVSQRNSFACASQGSVRGNCHIAVCRSPFSKSAWSVKSARAWISVPEEVGLPTTHTKNKVVA